MGNVAGVDQIFLYSNGENRQITANIYNINIGIESLQINNQGQIAWSQYDYQSRRPRRESSTSISMTAAPISRLMTIRGSMAGIVYIRV